MRRTVRTAIVIFVTLAFPLGIFATASAAARDSDGDRMPDRWERRHGLRVKVKDAHRDRDKDGLTNRQEYRLDRLPGVASHPRVADTDGDGIPDGAEDHDGDGLSTLAELALGGNPRDGNHPEWASELPDCDEEDAEDEDESDEDEADEDESDEDESDEDEADEDESDEDEADEDEADEDEADEDEADCDEGAPFATIVSFDPATGLLTVQTHAGFTIVGTVVPETELEWDSSGPGSGDCGEDDVAAPEDLQPGLGVTELEFDDDTGALEEVELLCPQEPEPEPVP